MWLADKCSSVKKPAHNGLFLVQKYKIQLLYSLNCQTKTINCHYKFSTSKCVKAHFHERINRIHIYGIFIIIIRYHVLCIYDLYVLSYGKQIASVVAVRMSSIVLKALQNCILNTYLLQVMQPILTYSWKISCSYFMILSALSFEEFWAWKILVICTIIKIWNMICTEE